jgi:D-arabinose 1-dehydrogenase-like Zn-dependent alcohol dehydrogenase
VVDALSLVAAGDVWPVVTEIRPLDEANELHDRIEAGEVIGRAAVLID